LDYCWKSDVIDKRNELTILDANVIVSLRHPDSQQAFTTNELRNFCTCDVYDNSNCKRDVCAIIVY